MVAYSNIIEHVINADRCSSQQNAADNGYYDIADDNIKQHVTNTDRCS
jgi:hypothetical protein